MDQKQTIKVATTTGDIEINFYVTADSAVQIQHVTFTQNGQTIAHKSYAVERISGIHPYSLDIWRHYETVRRGHLVIRSGFGLCGCYNKYQPNSPPDPHRQESDTEHASGCVEIVRSLAAYYPDLLTPNFYRRAEYLLKDHDLGENEYGDHPDDGSQNRAEKDRSELISFALATAHLPAQLRQTLVADFIRFQDPLFPGHPRALAELVQLAKVVDKIEAILSATFYEKTGAAGDLFHKEEHYSTLTEQDRHFIREAGNDSSIVAGWLAHTVYEYHMYYGFPYLLDVVKAAVTDVRGAWFPWFDDFCERNQIPDTHTTHPLLST